MSRSGYCDEVCGAEEQWALIRWRGAVKKAINGSRGQALILDLIKALDAMSERRLIAEYLVDNGGEVCALGAVGRLRGVDLAAIDHEDHIAVADALGVSKALVREIEYENDEMVYGYREKMNAERWRHMRDWAARSLQPETYREYEQTRKPI